MSKNYNKIQNVFEEVGKIVVGQNNMVRRLMMGLFTQGHILLEGVPGLAKTLTVNTLANVLKLDFKRIQFTPDLMPSDIIGAEILDENRNFKFIKGPIFSNVILADGDIAVIGGVLTQSIGTTKRGIPGLSKIPLLGALFRSKANTDTFSELLIFIAPRII